jgi:SAM-dependent methyltransferase
MAVRMFGSGTDILALKALHPDTTLYGVDIHEASLEAVRSRGIRGLCLNIETDRLPLDNESIDVAIANQVFEHLKEVFWALHECCRVLAVGGHLVVGVPNLASLHNRLLLLIGRQPTCIKTVGAHVRGFTKRDVMQFVDTVSGGALTLAKFAGSNFYPLPGSLAQPFASLFPNAAVGSFFLFKKIASYEPTFIEYLRTHPYETNFFAGLPVEASTRIALDQ